jgi:RNA polymerase sigma-70 factor, ECF subfamily
MIRWPPPNVIAIMQALAEISFRSAHMPPSAGTQRHRMPQDKMTDKPDDDPADLIRAIAERRDRAAFARLFALYAPWIKAYLLRLALPDERAEELAQETMLAVWRKADQFDATRASASTWVFAIARNLRIDAKRRDRLLIADMDPAIGLADMPEPSPNADAMMLTADRDRRVREALVALPAEQGEVVRLSFFEDRPHSEIGATLGIPLGTVKSRLRLAVVRLRALLGDAS